jgi:hypothetical protein
VRSVVLTTPHGNEAVDWILGVIGGSWNGFEETDWLSPAGRQLSRLNNAEPRLRPAPKRISIWDDGTWQSSVTHMVPKPVLGA